MGGAAVRRYDVGRRRAGQGLVQTSAGQARQPSAQRTMDSRASDQLLRKPSSSPMVRSVPKYRGALLRNEVLPSQASAAHPLSLGLRICR